MASVTIQATVVAVLVLVCAAPAALGQYNGQQTYTWSVYNYPDPYSFDTHLRCGRSNRSNICDPNRIIANRTEVDMIDQLIQRVYRESRCKCPSCIHNRHGYVIRVAVMPRMESILRRGNSSYYKLEDAQMYSYILSQKWALGGSCNESLVILYSRYDGILYTLTLPAVREVLDDETVKTITYNVRPLFEDEANVGRGLMEMVELYRLVLTGQKKEALRPRAARQQSNGAVGRAPPVCLSLLLATLLTLLR